jgi:alkaline phosphatase D
MLGEEQWKWLEKELRDNDAQITFIGSGVQVISDDKNVLVEAESWGKHPASRTRLLHLIASYVHCS